MKLAVEFFSGLGRVVVAWSQFEYNFSARHDELL